MGRSVSIVHVGGPLDGKRAWLPWPPPLELQIPRIADDGQPQPVAIYQLDQRDLDGALCYCYRGEKSL